MRNLTRCFVADISENRLSCQCECECETIDYHTIAIVILWANLLNIVIYVPLNCLKNTRNFGLLVGILMSWADCVVNIN